MSNKFMGCESTGLIHVAWTLAAATGLAILPLHSAEPVAADSKPIKPSAPEQAKVPQAYKISPPPVGSAGAAMNQSGNKLTVSQQDETAIIHVTSASGLGKLTIQPQAKPWPENVIVRLHLKGLEGFTVSNESIAMNLQDLNIKAYHNDGTPFPNKYLMDIKGYYEVVIPRKLIADKTTSITIAWTDFYR